MTSPLSRKILFWSVCFLFVGSLTTTAGMNLTAGFFLLSLCYDFYCRKNEYLDVIRQPLFKKSFFISMGLVFAIFCSLLFAKLFPYEVSGVSADFSLISNLSKPVHLLRLFFIALAWWMISEMEREKIFKAWWLVAALLSGVGVIQFFTGWPRNQPIPHFEGYYHATLFMGFHLSVASIMIFPYFSYLSSGIKSRFKKWRSTRFWVVVFLMTVALVLTFARSLWISLPFGLVLFVLWALPKKMRKGALICLVLALIFLAFQPFVQKRFLDPRGYTDRIQVWTANFEMIKDRPWFGVGFQQNSTYVEPILKNLNPEQKEFFVSHAHNNWIEMASSLGGVGFLAFLVFNLYWFVFLVGHTKKHPEKWWFGAACISFLVFHMNGITQVNFWEGKVIHQWVLVLGVSLGYALPKKNENRFPR